MSLNDIPAQYRPVGPYIKVANDFKDHDKVLYYWILNYAVEKAMTLGDSTVPELRQYLVRLLDVLEKVKGEHTAGDESFIAGPVAQCHVEAKALRLFTNADEQDRQGIFNKNVVRSFYTSGLLFDVLTLFTKEELEDKLQEARKYAKWKATEIHNCLKEGRTPQAGPPNQANDEDAALTRELLNLDVNKPQPTPRSTSNVPAPNQQQNFGNQPTMGQNSGWQQPTQPPQQQFHPGYNQSHQQFGSQSHQQFGGQPFPPQPQFQPTQSPQHHHNPPPQQQHYAPAAQTNSVTLDDFIEARKLTKMATSALDYEDSKTAIDFLRKALKVLEKN